MKRIIIPAILAVFITTTLPAVASETQDLADLAGNAVGAIFAMNNAFDSVVGTTMKIGLGSAAAITGYYGIKTMINAYTDPDTRPQQLASVIKDKAKTMANATPETAEATFKSINEDLAKTRYPERVPLHPHTRILKGLGGLGLTTLGGLLGYLAYRIR